MKKICDKSVNKSQNFGIAEKKLLSTSICKVNFILNLILIFINELLKLKKAAVNVCLRKKYAVKVLLNRKILESQNKKLLSTSICKVNFILEYFRLAKVTNSSICFDDLNNTNISSAMCLSTQTWSHRFS